MINLFDDFRPITSTATRQLPVGGYVCTVLGTTLKETAKHQQIIELQLEIKEGEYANFFTEQQKRYSGAKYKGVYDLWVPTNSSEQWAKDSFNRAIGAFTDSNQGYTFTGDETSLRNKTIGILTRRASYNGNEYTEIGMLINANAVRSGNYKNMKPRLEKEAAAPDMPALVVNRLIAVEDDELPF